MEQRELERDRFFSTHFDRAAGLAFQVLDKMQKDPEAMMAGVAGFFLLLCERYGVEPRDMLQGAANMLRTARIERAPGYEAIRRCLEDKAFGGFRDD